MGSAALALVLAAAPDPALAGEDEWMLSLEGGWGLLTRPDAGDDHGGGAALDAWLGLTEETWLFASAGARIFSGDDPVLVETVAGIVAALDVLRTVPFVEIAAGVDVLGGEVSPLLRIGIGADYLITPSFAVGGAVRYRPLFLTGSDRLVTIDLRLSYRADL